MNTIQYRPPTREYGVRVCEWTLGSPVTVGDLVAVIAAAEAKFREYSNGVRPTGDDWLSMSWNSEWITFAIACNEPEPAPF